MTDPLLDLERVIDAAQTIPSHFQRTPQYRSEELSRLLGVGVILKVETVNPTGTAASRGAEWWFECQTDANRVVCPSADDFGLAMAHAGRSRGIEVELFGPLDADPAKVEALRHTGTIVRLDGRDREQARAEAERYSTMVDALFVDEGSHVEFAEGSATIAAELGLLETWPDSIFVPIGDGGLAQGTAAWCHERMPCTRVIGVAVEPAQVPALVVGMLDDTVIVDERHLEQAAAALLAHEGIRISAAGSAALAATALAAPEMSGANVVVTVTGRRLG